MKQIFFSLVILFLVISCSENTKKNDNQVLISKIDSIINSNGFNGVVLVSQDSSIIYKKAFGYSKLEGKIPLKEDDQFYIGSISKQITAVLILKEYEKGNLNLSDTINKYLPKVTEQPWYNQVTIHHLLTHTHGIIALNEPLEFEVGKQFHYSQIGFGLLAQILEKVTGKTLEELSTELFAKHKLANTFHPDNRKYKNLVEGYEEDESGKLEYAVNNPVEYIAAGGFISNAEDLLKWNRLLHSFQLVNSGTLELMKTRYATRFHPIFDNLEYGYGLVFKNGEQDTQIGAFGYSPGYPTANYYYPESDMNLIVLENIALNLDDFKKTFKTHTALMDLIKNECSTKAMHHTDNQLN